MQIILTAAEINTVKTLVRLGDSETLATQTVISGRPQEAMKMAQVQILD